MVYEDAEVLYAEVAKDGKQLIDEALDVLLKSSVSLDSLEGTGKMEGDVLAINSTPFHRRELVQVPLSIGWTDSPGKRVAQVMHNRKRGYAVADVAGKRVCGLTPLQGRASGTFQSDISPENLARRPQILFNGSPSDRQRRVPAQKRAC